MVCSYSGKFSKFKVRHAPDGVRFQGALARWLRVRVSGYSLVVCYCGHANQPSAYKKRQEHLDQLTIKR
jgi:hypothetical protein